MKQWLTLCDEINVFISSFSVDEMSIFFLEITFITFTLKTLPSQTDLQVRVNTLIKLSLFWKVDGDNPRNGS